MPRAGKERAPPVADSLRGGRGSRMEDTRPFVLLEAIGWMPGGGADAEHAVQRWCFDEIQFRLQGLVGSMNAARQQQQHGPGFNPTATPPPGAAAVGGPSSAAADAAVTAAASALYAMTEMAAGHMSNVGVDGAGKGGGGSVEGGGAGAADAVEALLVAAASISGVHSSQPQPSRPPTFPLGPLHPSFVQAIYDAYGPSGDALPPSAKQAFWKLQPTALESLVYRTVVAAAARPFAGLPEIAATISATGAPAACHAEPRLKAAVTAVLDACLDQSGGDVRVLRLASMWHSEMLDAELNEVGSEPGGAGAPSETTDALARLLMGQAPGLHSETLHPRVAKLWEAVALAGSRFKTGDLRRLAMQRMPWIDAIACSAIIQSSAAAGQAPPDTPTGVQLLCYLFGKDPLSTPRAANLQANAESSLQSLLLELGASQQADDLVAAVANYMRLVGHECNLGGIVVLMATLWCHPVVAAAHGHALTLLVQTVVQIPGMPGMLLDFLERQLVISSSSSGGGGSTAAAGKHAETDDDLLAEIAKQLVAHFKQYAASSDAVAVAVADGANAAGLDDGDGNATSAAVVGEVVAVGASVTAMPSAPTSPDGQVAASDGVGRCRRLGNELASDVDMMDALDNAEIVGPLGFHLLP